MSSKNSLNEFSTHTVDISASNIGNQIAALLYATKYVKDDDEIFDIQMKPMVEGWLGDDMSKAEDIVPVSFKIRRRKEVEIIKYNDN